MGQQKHITLKRTKLLKQPNTCQEFLLDLDLGTQLILIFILNYCNWCFSRLPIWSDCKRTHERIHLFGNMLLNRNNKSLMSRQQQQQVECYSCKRNVWDMSSYKFAGDLSVHRCLRVSEWVWGWVSCAEKTTVFITPPCDTKSCF